MSKGCNTQHVVCYSGGHSSALVAIEVAAKFGTAGLVLLNHDIADHAEDADIKRFKRDVAEYIGVQVTYANIGGQTPVTLDQFDVCIASQAFKAKSGQELCIARLKTEPFMDWLEANADPENCVIYYGFDANEMHRIQKRAGIMGTKGWRTDYPLVTWARSIDDVGEIGITAPLTYSTYKHANCVGCLKAGIQHWYVVYCTRRDIWDRAKAAEEKIGHSIHWDDGAPLFLEDLEARFAAMRAAGVPATEHIPQQRFWAGARKILMMNEQQHSLPCECAV